MLRLAFLGSHRVDADAERFRWRNRKSIALLALLALDPGRCSKDWLAQLLWPDGTRAQARVNLRNLIFHTRRGLGPEASAIADSGADLALVANAYTCDVADFLDQAARPEAASQALDCYQGELLAGFDLQDNEPFEEWLTGQRQQLHRIHLRTVKTAYDRARLSGDTVGALDYARRWVTAETYDERGRRAVIRSLVRAGDRAGAIAAYGDWEQTARRDLGTEPDGATAELFRRVAERPSQPRRLPVTAPLFRPRLVGRDGDLAWLQQETRDDEHSRLILIRGERGIGRTRLLSEYAAALRGAGQVALLGRTLPDTALPLQSLSDAIRAWFAKPSGDPAEVFRDIAAVDLAELARLVPEVRRLRPDLPQPLPGWPAEVDRRLALVVASTLSAIARQAGAQGRRPVLCLDDLEHSSEPTLHALAAYLTNVEPSLLVATVAGTESRLSHGWMSGLHGVVSVLERTPEKLSLDQTAAMLQSMGRPGPQPMLIPIAQTIYELSEGTPGRIVELMRSLFDRNVLRTDSGGQWELHAAGQAGKPIDTLHRFLDEQAEDQPA